MKVVYGAFAAGFFLARFITFGMGTKTLINRNFNLFGGQVAVEVAVPWGFKKWYKQTVRSNGDIERHIKFRI